MRRTNDYVQVIAQRWWELLKSKRQSPAFDCMLIYEAPVLQMQTQNKLKKNPVCELVQLKDQIDEEKLNLRTCSPQS